MREEPGFRGSGVRPAGSSAAAGPYRLASPDRGCLAPTPEAIRLLSNRPARTPAAAVLDKRGDEKRVIHGMPSALRDSQPLGGRECAIVHAECAGVSGLGYYAAGPGPDVLGRLRQGEAVLMSTCRCRQEAASAPPSASGGHSRRSRRWNAQRIADTTGNLPYRWVVAGGT